MQKIRLALLVMLFVYPVITGVLYLLPAFTNPWGIWQKTLILVPIVVTSMVFLIIPNIHRFFGGWIKGGK